MTRLRFKVPNSGQIKVAVVDDDESLCRSLASLLRAHGLESSTFPSAEIFLEADPADFDCLVLDLQLGGASGVELQHSLSKGLTSPPIIFITAHDDPAVRQQALDGGCAGYFKKTDPGEAIVNRIREAVATRSQA